MSVIKPALQHPDRIAYFSGANNYSWIYFRDGEKKLLAKSISYLENQLPTFIRVHKTALINPSYIKSLQQPPRKKMAGKVYLDSGEVFPVSRRRWSQVVEFVQNQQEKIRNDEIVDQPVVRPITVSIDQAKEQSIPSILLITSNEENARSTEETIRLKWPAYQFHTLAHSSLLPDMLKQLLEHERPALLMLDARTQTLERLSTLNRIKADTTFHRIPIVLFVLPTDQGVIDGYQHQANSVISIPAGYILFNDIVERICHFWLHMVKLPTMRLTQLSN